MNLGVVQKGYKIEKDIQNLSDISFGFVIDFSLNLGNAPPHQKIKGKPNQ